MDKPQIARKFYTIHKESGASVHSFLEMADFVLSNFVPIDKSDDIPWIDIWLNFFPNGVKNAGKPIRSEREICVKKMLVFIKKYPYSAQEILDATEAYMNERSLKNYAYTMLASNYISHREKGSLLAQHCEENRNEKKTVQQYTNHNDFI